MISSHTLFPKFVLLALTASLSLACSKKKDDDDDEDPLTDAINAPGGGGVAATGNIFAASYPTSLAVSVFPGGAASSFTLEGEEDPNAGKSTKEKKDDNEKKLKGEAECLDMRQFRQLRGHSSVTCYEFDSDMNPTQISGDERTFGTVDGTNGAGEACMVSFTRGEVDDAVQAVDTALALVTGMLCQAKKDGLATELPGIGETIDLAPSFANAGQGKLSISTAQISRKEDKDGNPVYRNDVTVTNEAGHQLQVHLVHSPSADGTSSGTLWMQRPGNIRLPAGMESDPNNSQNKNDVMSINYANSTNSDGSPRVQLELRRAMLVNSVEPFDANGLVNYGGVAQDASNADIHAIKFLAFDMNPYTNAGNLSYWMNPGGNYNESARGFLFNVADDGGSLKGCGISGATANVSIRKALAEPSDANTLKPVRYWHPRETQNISANKDSRFTANEGSMITEQCFAQGSDGVYSIDTAVTTHARGYDVVATGASDVTPPSPPAKKLDGVK